MPELLDLPAELIELIYEAHENLMDEGNTYRRGQFRLACRYIERASRYPFRVIYFSSFKMRLSEVGSDRFCAVSQTADLARSIRSLIVLANDDGVREVAASTNTSRDGSDLADNLSTFDSKLGLLLPRALVSRRGCLIKALRACESLFQLTFFPHVCNDTKVRLEPGVGALFDISSSFDFILTILAQAGTQPGSISIHAFDNRTYTYTGLTDAAGLLRGRQALRNLTNLSLTVTEPWRTDVVSSDEA